MDRKPNLEDKDAILVSLYDDLLRMDLPNLLTFRAKSFLVLLTLEAEFNPSFASRTIKFQEEVVDITNLSDIRGAAHADITNLRFLLQGRPRDAANAQLRDLKAQSLGCIEQSPKPKKPVFKIKHAEGYVLPSQPVSPSPLSHHSMDVQNSPAPHIELKPRGGNGLNVSSRLTNIKRKLETGKLLSPGFGSVKSSVRSAGSADPNHLQQGALKPDLEQCGGKKSGSLGNSERTEVDYAARVPSAASAMSLQNQSSFSAPATPKGRVKNMQAPSSSRSAGNGRGKFEKRINRGIHRPIMGDKPVKPLQPIVPSPKIKVVSSSINGKQQGFERKIAPLKKKWGAVGQPHASDVMIEQNTFAAMNGQVDENMDVD